MKKITILCSLLLIVVTSCFSQFSKKKLLQSKMIDPKDNFLISEIDISNETIDQLKKTKTVFFCKKNTDIQIDSLKQAITSAWDLTELIFDDINNFNKYASNKNYSYFIIEGYRITTTSQSGDISGTHYYLTLRLHKEVIKKGEKETLGLCRIELYPNYQTLNLVQSGNSGNVTIDELYKNGVFYNWNPILLKAQLGIVSSNIKHNIRPALVEDIRNKNLSQLLSNDTLYVPKSLLVDFAAFSGKEKEKEENVFENYKYKYRICTDKDLFDIFETQKRGRLLFEYVKSSTDKFVSVYDLKEKNIVYKRYTPSSYNLKSKDVEKIE